MPPRIISDFSRRGTSPFFSFVDYHVIITTLGGVSPLFPSPTQGGVGGFGGRAFFFLCEILIPGAGWIFFSFFSRRGGWAFGFFFFLFSLGEKRGRRLGRFHSRTFNWLEGLLPGLPFFLTGLVDSVCSRFVSWRGKTGYSAVHICDWFFFLFFLGKGFFFFLVVMVDSSLFALFFYFFSSDFFFFM